MPRSQKTEEKTLKEKESKTKLNKHHGFKTEVTLINHGKFVKGVTFSREDVKKYSSSKFKKSVKPRKPFTAKVYVNRIVFKDRIVLGNRNKRVLDYEDIKLLEQLSSDSRMVFVNYDKPRNDYFLVLGLSDTDHVTKFMTLVSKNNSNTEIRWADTASSDGNSEHTMQDEVRTAVSGTNSPKTYYEQESVHHRRASTPPSSISDSYKGKQWTTTSSYICADPRFDDGTAYSIKSDSFASQKNKSHKHSHRRDSYDSLDLNHESRWRVDGLTTQYYYVGPSDGEDSISKKSHREKSKQKKSHHHKHKRYTLGDEVSVSMTPSSIFSDVDYYTNDSFNVMEDISSRNAPSRKSNISRKSSRRSKSRELPLSEAERNKGGWHSDVIFVTPTKDGGVKVSADGPVMLYTATRANSSRSSSSSSDEDSTSDGDSDFSYSSGSTITLQSPERNHTRFGLEVDYTNGRR